jgi:hypothetical protein
VLFFEVRQLAAVRAAAAGAAGNFARAYLNAAIRDTAIEASAARKKYQFSAAAGEPRQASVAAGAGKNEPWCKRNLKSAALFPSGPRKSKAHYERSQRRTAPAVNSANIHRPCR